MRIRSLLTLAALAALLSACGSQSPGAAQQGVVRAADTRVTASVSPADAAALADGNSLFAGRLLAELAQGGQTVVISPFSISEALSMVYAGARGQTASQMASALDFQLPPARLFNAFNALGLSLERANGAGAQLSVANALYGQIGTRFRQAFLAILARDYGAGMRVVDFAHAAAQAAAEINAWVAAQTHGKIPNLLSPADVDPSTQLMLINAVYLHAKWLSPFKSPDTVPAPFHAPGGTEQVPMMNQNGSFPYLSAPGYQALELLYQGGRLAFDVLLPDSGAMPRLLSQLAADGPISLLDGLSPQRVSLSLPKLLLRTSYSLVQPLSALGMRQAFTPGADLSGIAGTPGQLLISGVIHQAYLRVDEAGTEAAAVTAVSVGASAIEVQPPPIVFDVDRPFVFVIRDLQTNAVLFIGVITTPQNA